MKRYLVRAAPPAHFPWIVRRAGCSPTPEARAIEAVDAAGNVRGMVLYDAWTENAVQVHIAVETPMAWRALLPAGLEYPFLQAKRGIIIGIISGQNRASLAFARRIGFREVARIPDGYRVGEEMVVFQLRREDCWQIQERRAA